VICFRSIRWRNFLSTGNAFTEIDLVNNHLSLIVGKNGAGKSTLLDALSFVLFGKPFRNINKNQLINSINKNHAEVHINFDIGPKQYQIIRGIKPNIFEIKCNGQLFDQNADQKEYQEMLEKQILKINHKSFNQVVILGSASFIPFMQLTAANRRDVIEDLLDIEIFSKMNVLLKDKIQQNKELVQQNSLNIKQLQTKVELKQSFIDEKKQNVSDNIEQKNEQKNKLLKNSKDNKKTQEDLVQQYSSLEEKKDILVKKQHKAQKLLKLKDQLDSKIQKIDSEIKFFHQNNDCPTCKQTIELLFKSNAIEAKNILKQKTNEGMIELKQQLEKYNSIYDEIACVSKQLESILKQKQTITTQIAINQKLIENIDNDINCLQTKEVEIDKTEIDNLILELKIKQSEYETLLQEKQLLDVASLLLKDTGIKTKIIKQYVPVMNKLINKYLAAMDFFVNFELNENFEETIKSRFRDDFAYESFSEGEKMRIDLALLFTWRAIAKLRNSASTNLLILDEIFDSSLDNEGTDEFMKIIIQLTKENNTFIISHKGDQLFDKFQNVIRFEKRNNFSKIV
jgi:DNA repair exonuclease SbcCD ATPase subunit